MIIALQILAVWLALNMLALPVWMHFISLRYSSRSNIEPTRLSARKLRVF